MSYVVNENYCFAQRSHGHLNCRGYFMDLLMITEKFNVWGGPLSLSILSVDILLMFKKISKLRKPDIIQIRPCAQVGKMYIC